MGLIGVKDENWDYFKEDFDYDDDLNIPSDKFDEDFKTIQPHIEQVVFNVLQMMDQYCKDEY